MFSTLYNYFRGVVNMVMSNLRVLLAERRLTSLKVSGDTGISRTTLGSLINNNAKGIQFETLNTLCMYLGAEPGQLFVYVPFNMSIEGISRNTESIVFKIYDKGRSKLFSLWLGVDIDNEDVPIDDDGNCMHIPRWVQISVAVLDPDRITDDDRLFFSYYDRLPKCVTSYFEEQIVGVIHQEVVQDVYDAYGDDPITSSLIEDISFDFSINEPRQPRYTLTIAANADDSTQDEAQDEINDAMQEVRSLHKKKPTGKG